MRICSNCKSGASVSSRTIGESFRSSDPRESMTPSHIDLCDTCWSALRSDRLDTFNSRFRPFTLGEV